MRYCAYGHGWLWGVLWDAFAHPDLNSAQTTALGLGFRGGRSA